MQNSGDGVRLNRTTLMTPANLLQYLQESLIRSSLNYDCQLSNNDHIGVIYQLVIQ